MRKYILLFIFFASLLVSCQPLMDRIYWSSYPGSMKDGQCETYAKAVNENLQRRGIKSYYVEFDWERGNKCGRHSVVIFEEKNEWFVVDNEKVTPKKVKKGSLLEMLRDWISKEYKIIQIVN